ncbi:hypothetical protein A2U01_0072794, partial [Trifolium medium]|nr:hypothetical protein [Trifolium medium]
SLPPKPQHFMYHHLHSQRDKQTSRLKDKEKNWWGCELKPGIWNWNGVQTEIPQKYSTIILTSSNPD